MTSEHNHPTLRLYYDECDACQNEMSKYSGASKVVKPTDAEIVEVMARAIRETRCATICACTGMCHTNKAKAAFQKLREKGMI